MNRSKNEIITAKEELANYVDGYDVYNSELLLRLSSPDIEYDYYRITNYEFRPDLIARDYYGSEKYVGIVLILGAKTLVGYYRGEVLRLVPKDTVDKILEDL